MTVDGYNPSHVIAERNKLVGQQDVRMYHRNRDILLHLGDLLCVDPKREGKGFQES